MRTLVTVVENHNWCFYCGGGEKGDDKTYVILKRTLRLQCRDTWKGAKTGEEPTGEGACSNGPGERRAVVPGLNALERTYTMIGVTSFQPT